MSRPQDKHLIPLTKLTLYVLQAARRHRKQQYLLGKYAGMPILDKRTISKFEKMGFEKKSGAKLRINY